jgi:glycosyltransferase involved in cell wall biosynthesis
MRIGFDVSPLYRAHPRGIVRVVSELTDELERRGVLDVVRLAPPDGVSLRTWRQSTLPGLVRAEQLVGIHSFLSAFPWRGPGRRVATIHELPWKHGVKENAGARHRFWATLGRWRADRIVTATEVVARELGAASGRRSKIRVVPWGVGSTFEDEPPPGVVDEPVLAKYGLTDGAFALCVGAVRPKKNLAAVLHGVAELRRRNGPRLQLVVTGKHTTELRRDLGLASKLGLSAWLSTPGSVDEADLPALYRLASVVPFLSRSEGFGLPVLEALACGTPVVVPSNSAQAEVAGEHGIQVDSGDAGSVADGLARALEERESLRYQLADRARELSWSHAAERIEELWAELE